MPDDDCEQYNVGDRIILTGLQKAARLNGRHGVVAVPADPTTGRYGVDLDLLANVPTVAVKPVNLQREQAIPPESKRAGTQGGILVEQHGRDLSFLLDNVRYIVGVGLLRDRDIQYPPDIDRIKDEDMVKINYLTATGWTHWADPGAYKGTKGRGVYQCLKEYLQNDTVKGSGWTEENMPSDYCRIYNAIDEPSAVAGWNVRVHGDFWIVDKMDQDGTYLIPEANTRAVYQVLGITQPLLTMVQRSYGRGRVVKMRLTMIPWYGRLVYDGVASPVDKDGAPGGPQIASEPKADKLRQAVQLAKEEGRIVTRLTQLEVPGGSRVGAGPAGEQASAQGETEEASQQQQEAMSKEERRLVEELKKIPHIPESMGAGLWTFRRACYTEDENPNHEGVVLRAELSSDASSLIGPFECSALEPSSVDILVPLVKYSQQEGYRPRTIAIDDKACFERVQHLLLHLENADAYFYLPPSKEESAAAQLCDTMRAPPI